LNDQLDAAGPSAPVITAHSFEEAFEQLLQELLPRHHGDEKQNYRQEGDHRELEHRVPREWHNALVALQTRADHTLS
jgi:hypothetical protein